MLLPQTQLQLQAAVIMRGLQKMRRRCWPSCPEGLQLKQTLQLRAEKRQTVTCKLPSLVSRNRARKSHQKIILKKVSLVRRKVGGIQMMDVLLEVAVDMEGIKLGATATTSSPI